MNIYLIILTNIISFPIDCLRSVQIVIVTLAGPLVPICLVLDLLFAKFSHSNGIGNI